MAKQSSVPESYPPFSAEERSAAAADVQGMLVDLVGLALIGKQAHWNVEGRQFRLLHLELDELVDAWRSLGGRRGRARGGDRTRARRPSADDRGHERDRAGRRRAAER